MKNLLKIIGVVAVITVLGFSMITCGEEEAIVGDVVIGFFEPEYEGNYVKAEGIIASTTPPTLIIVADTYSVGKTAKYGTIKNNSVSLSAWNVNGESFSGDGVLDDLTIYIYETASDTEPLSSLAVSSVTIKGGKSTVNITGQSFP